MLVSRGINFYLLLILSLAVVLLNHFIYDKNPKLKSTKYKC